MGLLDNLIDAGTQLKVSATQSLFRWQKFDCRAAAGSVFLDLVGRRELETISLMSMQAREVQIMVARDLRHRLAGWQGDDRFRDVLDADTFYMFSCPDLYERTLTN